MLGQFYNALPAQSAPFLSDEFTYTFLQLAVCVAFIVTAVRAWRTPAVANTGTSLSPARWLELITAVLFGLLLEEGDILIFGTYSYNRHWLSLGNVPIAIGLTWAMIIASAMNFSDALGLPSIENLPRPKSRLATLGWLARGSVAPIADAVWAIMLDLSLDAVAIRLGLWAWTIPLNEGWFGVP